MFEANMLDNIESMKNNAQWNNPWRELVTPQFKTFLDSLSKDNSLSTSKEDTTEDSEL